MSTNTVNLRGLFPTWSTLPRQYGSFLARKTRRVGERSTFHIARAPKYYGRTVKHSHVGVKRSWDYFLDAEGRRMKKRAAMPSATPEEKAKWLEYREAHSEDMKFRLALGGTGTGFLGLGTIVSHFMMGTPEQLLTGGAVGAIGLGVLGLIGKPDDEPIFDEVQFSSKAQELSQAIIVDALKIISTDLRKAIEADPKKAIRFHGPVARGRGTWSAVFDLPVGTCKDVVGKLDDFLGQLGDYSRNQVSVEEGEIPKRVILVITDGDVSQLTPKSPLLELAPIDIFEGYTIGHTSLRKPVLARVMGGNTLIGGVPDAGKSNTLRVKCAAFALDPRAEFFALVDLKGNGDLDEFEPLTRRHFVVEVDELGESNEREVKRGIMLAARAFKKECHRRATSVRKYTDEKKVTSDIASAHPDLGPIAFVIDEIQELILDEEWGPEARVLFPAIAKLCRAQAASLIYTTQTPTAESLPSELRKNTGRRFCHRVLDHETNDRVLPDGSYKAGIRATTIPEDVPGTVIMATSVESWTKFRVSYLSTPEIESIVAKRLEWTGPVDKVLDMDETQANQVIVEVDGQFVTDTDTDTQWVVDMLTISEGENKLQFFQILERLQEAFPARYVGIAEATVRGICEGRGLEIVDVHKKDVLHPVSGKPTTRKGIEIVALKNLVSK